MLVTFRSTATESVTLFGDVAMELLKLMGASGRVPGAFNPDEVPAALQRFETAIEKLKTQLHTATPAQPADNEDTATEEEEAEENEPRIDIVTRAVPLLSLLKRAAAAKAEVIWEGK